MATLPKNHLSSLSRWVIGLLFIGAGLLHLVSPAVFVQIVPPALPKPGLLVLVSGIFEILGGIGIMVPATRRFSRWGLVALLIAVFPANVYMAAQHIQPGEMQIPPALLWARLPFQPLLIWWVLAATVRKPGEA